VCDFLWGKHETVAFASVLSWYGRTRNGWLSAEIAGRNANVDDVIGPFRVVFDAIGLTGIAHEHDTVHGWIDGG